MITNSNYVYAKFTTWLQTWSFILNGKVFLVNTRGSQYLSPAVRSLHTTAINCI